MKFMGAFESSGSSIIEYFNQIGQRGLWAADIISRLANLAERMPRILIIILLGIQVP